MPRPPKRPISPSETTDSPGLPRGFARQLLDSIDIGVAHLSAEGAILYCNPRFRELLGPQKFHELVDLNSLKNIVSAASWPNLNLALRNARHSREEGQLEIESPEGTRIVRLVLSPVIASGGDTLQAVAIDTTDLVVANNVIRQRDDSLQSLTARILQVQDQERRRIARDLHDVTGQELVGISMALSSLSRLVKLPGTDLQKEIADCLRFVRKVEDDIRTLSYVLHPPLLDELGLASALSWYVEGFKKRASLNVELDMPADIPRLPIERETALFRVVQEGLTNVLRHSRSPNACLRVTIEGQQLVLSIEDEGARVAPPKLQAANDARPEFGVGIPGMRERLKQFGGSLELRSTASGTQLIARVPISAAAQPPAVPGALPHGVPNEDKPFVHSPTERVAAPPARNGRARILIADDHEVARRGIRDLIANHGDLEVCGEARDGLEAVAKARELQPDLIILDLSMPKVGGLSAAQHIRERGLSPKILIFSSHSYSSLERLVRNAGCEGYVEKSNAGEDLIQGIRALLRGDTFYNSQAIPRRESPVAEKRSKKARASGA
jgi:signal transduction histidine kinase/ActR/RegA family two-component response regulator